MLLSPEQSKIKVMTIGIDGATLDILLPLIKKGKLPNIASLIENGVSGELESTMPPISGPAWATVQTGLNPGKHGIFDFFRNIPEKYSRTMINSTFLPTKTLWEILSDSGKTVGIVNMLFTYPPKHVNGFIVSGGQVPRKEKEYTFPSSLKKEILQQDPNYKLDPFNRISQTKKFLREIPIHLNSQERIHCYLLKKYSPNFFMNYFPIPDIIHHTFWKHMDPLHPLYSDKKSQSYLRLIENCYQTLDDIIGKRMKMVNDETVIIVMSDHGGGPLHKFVQLNKWLQDQGLMSLEPGHQDKGHSFLRTLEKLKKRAIDFSAPFDIIGLRHWIGYISREKRRAFAMSNIIDWANTKAYAGRPGEQGIHCNLQGREKYGIVTPGKEYEKLREYIIDNLSQLRDPQSGNKIFNHIYKREEIYEGPFLSNAPDIIFDFGDAPYQSGDALLAHELFQDVLSGGVNGKHRQNGILLVHGKGIKKRSEIHGARLCDYAPTVLHLMGVPIPREMDGKVLVDIFEPAFMQKHPVKYKDMDVVKPESTVGEVTYTPEESESITDRLKSLGYL